MLLPEIRQGRRRYLVKVRFKGGAQGKGSVLELKEI